MRFIHKYSQIERNPGERFRGLVRRSTASLVCVGIIGIVFVTSLDPVLASDTSQISSTRSGLRTEVRTSADEIARLPVSNLNLIITGIIIGTPRRALICVEGRKDEPFAVGQAITSGVLLADVYLRGVVIHHDGVFEKLELRGAAGSSGHVRVESYPLPVSSLPPKRSAPAVHPIPDEAVRDQGNNSYVVKRSFVNMQLESADLLVHARIIPASDGGFRIIEIVPGSLYERLGFRDGDAILAINGAPATSYLDLVNFLQQRDKIDRMQVDVARGGDLYQMQYSLQ